MPTVDLVTAVAGISQAAAVGVKAAVGKINLRVRSEDEAECVCIYAARAATGAAVWTVTSRRFQVGL